MQIRVVSTHLRDVVVLEPEVFDVLVALSQDSCDAFLRMLRPGGTLVYEEELVRLARSRETARPAAKGHPG